jgi:outer membrane protein OmpA-like peptidoglycan-associated protein
MMRKIPWVLFGVICLSLLTVSIARAKETDVEGSKDNPLFSRMPGFYIHQYEEKEFDSHPFVVKNNRVNVEGHFYHTLYFLKSGVTEPSGLQILRNYENAITKIGGTVLASNYDGGSYLKLEKNGKEIWAHVAATLGSEYHVYLIEKEALAQKVVANAKVFSNDIQTTGHTSVYGIYFDSGKSEIKPPSEAALSEIAKLLKAQPSLKLYVVGHTDTVGNMDANLKLSLARAEAVVQTLVSKYGISAARLKGYGVSSLAPVASNDSEDGRAKNRRVELVKQ